MKAIKLLVLLLLCAGSVLAAELEMAVVLDDAGKRPVRVNISGHADKVCFLGVSFYPYGTTVALTQGRHHVLRIEAGDFEESFSVAPQLLNGGVECALWGRQILQEECQGGPCAWCQQNGYHLEQRLLYLYGSLAEVAHD